VSCSFFTFLEIVLARFADTWFMLFPEILHTTRPNLYFLVTSWTLDLAFPDGQVWVRALEGFLRVTGTHSGLLGSS
jgi:hypothetical protein